jgi:solute carrier family 35 protein E1
MDGGLSAKYLWTQSLLAGAFYYLYNEVAFLALGRVNPVTHAVGNTIKRVVIIVASVIAFKTPISTLGVIGSSIAIFGTLLYSLAKSKYG